MQSTKVKIAFSSDIEHGIDQSSQAGERLYQAMTAKCIKRIEHFEDLIARGWDYEMSLYFMQPWKDFLNHPHFFARPEILVYRLPHKSGCSLFDDVCRDFGFEPVLIRGQPLIRKVWAPRAYFLDGVARTLILCGVYADLIPSRQTK